MGYLERFCLINTFKSTENLLAMTFIFSPLIAMYFPVAVNMPGVSFGKYTMVYGNNLELALIPGCSTTLRCNKSIKLTSSNLLQIIKGVSLSLQQYVFPSKEIIPCTAPLGALD